MKIIAVANQKGGCGKTTTSINLASSLASKNQKTLLIDYDPQAHATMGLNIIPSDLKKTIYHSIKPGFGLPRMEDVLIPIKDNLDLAPSSTELSSIEQELSGVNGRENMLYHSIKSIKFKNYDFIIVDCPPSIGHLCFNALRAAQEAIIPIDLSLFSLRGVSTLMGIILSIKEKLGHEIQSRALITMYDSRTRYALHVMEKVRAEFGKNLFETVIRYNIRLRESVDHGVPVNDFDKYSIGNKDYDKLANEILGVGAVQTDQDYEAYNEINNAVYGTDTYSSVTDNSDIISASNFSAAEDLLT